MSRRLGVVALLAWAIVGLLAADASAGTRRYAVLIGLDDVGDQGLPDLAHAEREVRALTDVLGRLGRFEPTRITVLTGAEVTHDGLFAAFERLEAQMRSERAQAPDDDTLLLIVWSGHGRAGELLTRTRPVTAPELWRAVGRLGATVQVGFFDSCFSGSLTAKGIGDVTPFNPLGQLPDAPLGTRGSFNVSSSTGDQLSFEHPERGSLMLQALAQAFSQAAPERSAAALERDFIPFIVQRITRLADAYGVEQTPQWKSDLVSTRPIYMSWPLDRSARIALPDPAVDCVEVEYTDSGYVERLTAGADDAVEIYARPLRLARCDGGAASRRVDAVAPGQVITYVDGNRDMCDPRPGRCMALSDKAGGRRWMAGDAVTAHLGVGLGYGWPTAAEPAARGRGMVGARAGYGRWAAGLDIGFGSGDGEADGLRYDVIEGEARLIVDRVLWSPGPLDMTVGAGPVLSAGQHTWDASDAGDATTRWLHPGVLALGRLWLPVPLGAPWTHLTLGGGVVWQRRTTGYGAAGDGVTTGWRLTPMVELGAVSRRLSF